MPAAPSARHKGISVAVLLALSAPQRPLGGKSPQHPLGGESQLQEERQEINEIIYPQLGSELGRKYQNFPPLICLLGPPLPRHLPGSSYR